MLIIKKRGRPAEEVYLVSNSEIAQIGGQNMVSIRNFHEQDARQLQQLKYQHKSIEEIKEIINLWNEKVYNGSYYEMFAVCDQDEIVGSVSLYQHSDYIISAGPEIYIPYRKKGYGYEALMLAYDYAKDLGYKIASAQIRTDNVASMRLHEKLGFQRDCEMINRKGKSVYIYSKQL